MKKIKRTITTRKIEIIGNRSHIHDSNLSVCPLCHSPIPALPTANDSAVEHTTVESPTKAIEKIADKSGEETKG
jgi:hypothetical protein